jgi:hypothetical protein
MRARLATDYAPNLPPAPPGQVRLRGRAGLSEFVERAAPELAANAMVCVVTQAAYYLVSRWARTAAPVMPALSPSLEAMISTPFIVPGMA